MHITPLSELALYRYRYSIGYFLIALTALGLLVLNIQTLPPGLSAGEQASVIASSRLHLELHLDSFSSLANDVLHFLRTTDTVNLPYHTLQRISLHFFGVSALGVRLPSLILAGMTICLFLGVVRRWLRTNAAVVAAIFIATSSWFLSIGRLGTPDSMVIFWTVLIIFLATLVTQETPAWRLWKALSLLTLGLSLYTPYTIYLLAAAAIAAMTQPHLRYLVHYAGKASTTFGIFFFAIILIPLGFNIWNQPVVVAELLAIPTNLPSPIEFLQSFVASASALLNPLHISFETLPRPLITLPAAVLALMGGWRLFADGHSVRSHVLLIWGALLIPLIGLDASHNLIVLFVPVMLLSSLGMQSLIQYWYRLFPRNPYARVFGLLPLGLLIVSIVHFNFLRYFVGLPYAPTTVSLYDQDPFILTKTITSKTMRDQHLLLVTTGDKQELYGLDRSVVKNLSVITPAAFTTDTSVARVIVAESALPLLTPEQRALLPSGKTELLVNDRKDNGLRFRIFSRL